jgi:hypothetical protein
MARSGAMMRVRICFARAALVALCLTAPAFAAAPPDLGDATDRGIDNPGLDAARHGMPTPDVAPRPAADAPQAAPAVSANPLWAVPLSALAATRDRPLFTPSRRPPAPVIASVPQVAAPRPPPPPPAAPEHPNLLLVGTVAGEGEGVAVFIDQGTRDTVRLRTGEGHSGWILQSVERSAATLHKGDQTETLALPKPTEMQASAPIISPLPPPPPPPPQAVAPPSAAQAPPPPQSGTAAPPNPQPQGCMPPPIGC